MKLTRTLLFCAGAGLLLSLSCKRPQDFQEDIPLRRKVSLPDAQSSKSSQSPTGGDTAALGSSTCDGIQLAGTCRKIQSIGRCYRDVSGGLLNRNFIYSNQTAECVTAGYSVEDYPYFKTVASEGLLINRWKKTTADGIFFFYFIEGESPSSADPSLQLDGPAFRVMSESEAAGSSVTVPLVQCSLPCQGTSSPCNQSLTWLSLDSGCEVRGRNQGPIGWVIKP
jgi:hypothetical protein